MQNRNEQVARVLFLIDILSNVRLGLTVKELSVKLKDRGFSVTPRTLYRDLDVLATVDGFQENQSTEPNEASKFQIKSSLTIGPTLKLSVRELFALYFARGALSPLRDTPFFKDLESIFQKIESIIGKNQVEYMEELQASFKFEPSPAWGLGLNADVLDTITTACQEGHIIEARYFSANQNQESTRKLGPHYLYYVKGGVYLVAEDISAKKVKVFALPRFRAVTMLPDAYVGEISTPESFFDGSIGVFTGEKPEHVQIEFESQVASFVKERRWHDSQRVVSLEKGRIRVELDAAITPELISWVLGFGPSAKVITPPTLAEKVAVKAMDTVKIYSKRSA